MPATSSSPLNTILIFRANAIHKHKYTGTIIAYLWPCRPANVNTAHHLSANHIPASETFSQDIGNKSQACAGRKATHTHTRRPFFSEERMRPHPLGNSDVKDVSAGKNHSLQRRVKVPRRRVAHFELCEKSLVI